MMTIFAVPSRLLAFGNFPVLRRLEHPRLGLGRELLHADVTSVEVRARAVVVPGICADHLQLSAPPHEGQIRFVFLGFVAPLVAKPTDGPIPARASRQATDMRRRSAHHFNDEIQPAILLDDLDPPAVAVGPDTGKRFIRFVDEKSP